MDFRLSEEQEMIRKMARDFADNEIIPYCLEWDEKHIFPWDAVNKLQEVGLMTCGIPAEYGGPGIDHLGQAIIAEEICRGDAGLGTTLAASTLLGPDPVYIAASDEQKKWFYGGMMEGKLTAFCLTEPGAGSDAGGLATRCVRDGDDYILNGTKQFISNGGVANLYTVFATLDKKMGYKGMCAFMVDRDTPGISTGQPENKLGIRSSNTTQVIFEDVRVPAKNLLGKEGDGFTIAMKTLDISRAVVGAMATGVAQGAFECAVQYAKERQQFGKPIATFQGIQFILADMAVMCETARLLYQKAASNQDQGLPYTKMASLAKYWGGEAAMKVSTDAVQVYGGYGYTKDYPVEKYFRDAKIFQIFEGTAQIQKVVIAGDVLKG
ncbi:MAG: acyl-CoA dehydrogenase family protein [Syntrophomonadaceae bacterium]|nr:acyl-CoA dehydrogenase family protein [Syntrophomonadaceae bacterium]MDD3022910.1 acyl-CoA dehydrogenase family protein [Syntrophomonadaceae bacterium]